MRCLDFLTPLQLSITSFFLLMEHHKHAAVLNFKELQRTEFYNLWYTKVHRDTESKKPENSTPCNIRQEDKTKQFRKQLQFLDNRGAGFRKKCCKKRKLVFF